MAKWQKSTSVADIKAEEYLQKLAKKKEVQSMFCMKKWDVFTNFYPSWLWQKHSVPFQEAQEKLMELDRLSNELDAFIEKTKHATIEESEVQIF